MAQLQMDEGLLERQVRKISAASFPVDTVDERNPAKQLIGSLSNYMSRRFYTSQVVQDFFHQPYDNYHSRKYTQKAKAREVVESYIFLLNLILDVGLVIE